MKSGQSLNVLLIEDNPSDVLLLRTALDEDPLSKFELTNVERLADGLQKLAKDTFDIVLADLGLPDSSGLSTFEQLHNQAPNVPMVIFSGNEDEEQAIQAVRSGAQDYLAKSLSGFDMAARTIRHAIERNKLQSTLRESEERFSKVFQNSPVVMAIFDLETLSLLDVNKTYCSKLGYTKEEIINKPGKAGFSIAPSDFANVLDILKKTGGLPGIEVGGANKVGEKMFGWLYAEPIDLLSGRFYVLSFVDITDRKQAEEKLRESEQRFSTLFRLNPVPVGITRGSDFRIMDVNDAWTNLTGYTKEEAFGKTSAELKIVKPETLQQIRGQLESQRKVTQYEIPLYTRSGQERYVLISSEAVELNGELYFFNNLLDITERKQAEQKLYESEERHRLISELISDYVYKGTVAANGEVKTNWVSGAFERITGYSVEEVNQFPNGFFDLVRPDDLEALRRGQTQFFQERSRTAEYRIRRKNGDICWLRDYMQITTIDSQTSTIHLMGAVQDITERKQAEEKVIRNEEVLRLFVESSPAAIAMFDRDMHYIIASRRYLIDFRLGDQNLIGRSHYDVFPETTERQKAIHQGCLAGVVEKNDGHPFQRSDGTVDWVRWEIHPWYEANGRVGGIIFFSEVITERKQAEEKLRASEERYRNLIENMNELVMELDEGGNFCYISPNYTKLAGYSSEQELNTSALAHVHPDDIPLVLQAIQNNVLQSGQSIVYRVQAKSGDWLWIETSGHIYQTETGENHIISVARDVTERKQAEEALQESEERFSKAFFTSPVSQSIIAQGTNEIIEVNDACCRLFGYSREELIGATTSKLNLWQNPADRLSAVDELMKTGHLLAREAGIRTQSGEMRTGIVAIEPISWKGMPCLISFVVDITERKQFEANQAKLTERLNLAARSASLGIWDWDIQKNKLIWDERMYALYGLHSAEFKGAYESWLAGVYPDDRQTCDVAVSAAVQGEREYDIEFRVLWPDGSIRWLKANGQVFRDEHGAPLRMVGVNYDITERKQSEAELRLRGEVIANMAEGVVLVKEADATIAYTNPKFDLMFGYGSGELIGKPISWVNAPTFHNADAIAQEIIHKLREHGSWSGETQNIRKNGDVFWCWSNVSTLDHPEFGRVWVTVQSDITERKATEEALRESEERYQQFISQSFEAISRTEFDQPVDISLPVEEQIDQIYANAYMAECNQAMADMYHMSIDAFIGRRMIDVHGGKENSVNRDAFRKFIQNRYKSINDETIEYDAHGNRHWFLSNTVGTVENGKLIRLWGTSIEITDRKQTEEALRTSEERLRKTLETTSDGFWIVDSNHKFVDINEAYCAMSGYTREELLRMHISDVEAVQSPEDIDAQIERILSESAARFESRHRRKDGSLFDVEVSVNALRQGNNLMVCFCRDITERKQAERETIYRQEVLEKVIQLGKKITAITDLGACLREIYRCIAQGLGFERVGVFLYDSDADMIRGTYGTSRTGEMVDNTWYARPVKEWTDWQIALRSPKGMAFIQDYQATRQPAPDNEMYGVKQHLTLAAWAGEKPVALLTVDNFVSGKPITAMDQEALQFFTGYVGLAIENATLHTELEMKVRERTKEVQDLYDNAPAGYHSLDAAGRFTQINQTELTWLGYTHNEMIGRSILDILTPESIETFRRTFPSFKQTGALHDLEMGFIRKDRTILPALVNASAVYDSHGNYILSRSTIFDNTLRRQAEKSLQHANVELERALRMKDEFLASMSHELRTPLTGILGLSEALQYDTYGELSQKQKSIISTIESNGRHLLELINDILDISKMEAGKLELDMLPCALSEICQSSLQIIRGMAQKKGQQVAFSINPADIHVKGDARRLKQILVNLLSNAVKYSPERSSIGLDVTADQSTQTVRMEVWDNGIGISQDDLKRLFQPFVQLDSSLTRQQSGTGLGLALVQRLVDLHGGSIQVESTPGQGSRFTVILSYLPNASEAKREPAIMPEETHEPAVSSRESHLGTVMIVDDNETNILMIEDYLRSRDFNVYSASSGIDFLTKVSTIEPDIVLMDIQMPEMDGLETIRRLRLLPTPRLASVPVIAITALAMPGDREHCLEAGANEYLSKPIRLRGLAELIQQLLMDKKNAEG